MPPSLLIPQGKFDPEQALKLAQQAPAILKNNPKEYSRSPLVSLFTPAETPEIWVIYENLLLACLQTGDDASARECLERLVKRFGDTNPHMMALKGLVKEAEAVDDAALEKVLREYDEILVEDDANIAIRKRRVVVLCSLKRIADAVKSLNELLDISPTDGEAWAELSAIYFDQGAYPQAIHCLEEVLVLAPNSWSTHARLGQVLYVAAKTSPNDPNAYRWLAESLKRFCRCIELCDNYLKGYYGLKTITDRLLESPPTPPKKIDPDTFALPEKTTIERLNALATQQLAETVRLYKAQDLRYKCHSEEDIAAVQELLDQSTAKIEK